MSITEPVKQHIKIDPMSMSMHHASSTSEIGFYKKLDSSQFESILGQKQGQDNSHISKELHKGSIESGAGTANLFARYRERQISTMVLDGNKNE
jgi:hypothetical protein